MDIVTREYSFPSVTGLSDIYAKSWAPSEEREVTAVIQILHGMAEHIARYDAFASYLCGQGFAVFANDHVGHGKSAKSDEELGYFGEENGWKAFARDAKQVTDLARKAYPRAAHPYFLGTAWAPLPPAIIQSSMAMRSAAPFIAAQAAKTQRPGLRWASLPLWRSAVAAVTAANSSIASPLAAIIKNAIRRARLSTG